MKTIGVIAQARKKSGGVYQYMVSFIENLRDTEDKKYIIFAFDQEDAFFKQCGFDVRYLKAPKLNLFQKIIRYIQYLILIRKPCFIDQGEQQKLQDIDIFLCPTISVYPHYFLNRPFIFTLHDLQERYLPEFFTAKDRITRWIINRCLGRTAKGIICESDYVKNDIVKFIGVDAGKISVIPSPPCQDFLTFKPTKNQKLMVKEKYDLADCYIFYPAHCWPHKNHERLLKAFLKIISDYPDVQLVLSGAQQNNYQTVMQLVNDLNLKNHVKHLGYIDYPDIPYVYTLSEFLMMPSLFESISIPIYEAFALKTAVCSSNVVALPNQVGDAGLLFDPYDIDDMAKVMRQYLSDPKLMKEKARLGYERLKSYDMNIYRDNLNKLTD